MPCAAYDFFKDGVYYRIIDITDKDNPSCAATPANNVDGHPGLYEGNVVVPASVNYNGHDIKVVGIDDLTFMNSQGLESVVIEAPIETIPNYAFRNAQNLKSVTLPQTVKSIGGNAFSYCKSLKSIQLPAGLESIEAYAYENCTSLESIVIPDHVSELGDFVFSGCSSLTKVKFPESLTRIPEGVLRNCICLTFVTIPGSVTAISGWAFQNTGLTSIDMPQGLKTIGGGAFNNTLIKHLVIPDGVETIGLMAICEMPQLESLVIGSGVLSMGTGNITYCPALKEITFKDNTEPIKITEQAGYQPMFKDLTVDDIYVGRDGLSLSGLCIAKKLEFGPCVKKLTYFWLLEGGTFIMGPNIERICTRSLSHIHGGKFTFPASVKVLENECVKCDLHSVIFEDGDEPVEMGYKNITLPTRDKWKVSQFYWCNLDSAYVGRNMNYVRDSYNYHAPLNHIDFDFPNYHNSMKLSYLKFGDKVTRIGDSFASKCSSLRTLIFGNNIQSIGEGAFYGLGASRVKFPESIESIGSYAFYGSKLQAAILTGNLRTIGQRAFERSTSLRNAVLAGQLKSVASKTLSGCTSLETVALGEQVTDIASDALAECEEIKTLVVNNPVPPSVGTGTFANKVKFNAQLMVPGESVELYKNSQEWSDFWNISAFVPIESIESNRQSVGVQYDQWNCRLSLEQLGIELKYIPNNATFRRLKWQTSDQEIIVIQDDAPDNPIFVLRSDNSSAIITGQSLDGSEASVSIEIIIGEPNDVAEIEQDAAAVTVEGDMLYIDKCDGQPVGVYTLMGQVLMLEPSCTGTCGIRLPARGVYIVKVGAQSHKILYPGY